VVMGCCLFPLRDFLFELAESFDIGWRRNLWKVQGACSATKSSRPWHKPRETSCFVRAYDAVQHGSQFSNLVGFGQDVRKTMVLVC
jgi:hypothetical protein